MEQVEQTGSVYVKMGEAVLIKFQLDSLLKKGRDMEVLRID